MRAREQVFERRAEVLQIDRLVGGKQELRQRQLAFAEDPEGAGHRLARVAIADDRRGERVVAGLAVRPQVAHAGHHQREQRRQQFLKQVADEEVLLARLADDGRRDRSASFRRATARTRNTG